MLCRANRIVPDVWVFRHFFLFALASSGEYYTFSVWKYSHVPMTDQKSSSKNWANHFFWVNADRVGAMRRRVDPISDQSFSFYADKEAVARVLRSFEIMADYFTELVLSGAGMRTLRGNMPEFFSVIKGVEKRVKFTDVLAKKIGCRCSGGGTTMNGG